MRRMGVGILGEAAFEALGEERRAQVLANQTVEELRSPEALSSIDTETVAAIRCPVLLLGGDRSPPLFARLLDYLQELLPEAERATIPDASHIVHEDNPDAFHRAVESFLD